MQASFYTSAFVLGVLGSFHCAAMCGPIAIMLPVEITTRKRIFLGRLIYNSGRLLTYITLGLFFGLIGLSFTIKGWQNELSVLTGVIIIVSVLLSGRRKHSSLLFENWSSFIRSPLKKLFVRGGFMSLFFIGVINGLLPCGFVYLAIAGAMSSGHYASGTIYMILFGLGTFPMMMTLALAGQFASFRFQRYSRKITPVLAILLALFLIQRGSVNKYKGCCDKTNATSILSGN